MLWNRISIHTGPEAHAAAGGNSCSLVILVLPAVRILRERPGMVLVAEDLGTHYF